MNEQLERYERIYEPHKRISFYFTNQEEGKDVNEDSIFMKSYKKLIHELPESIQGKTYKTHILLVGFSIQPIILSIFALQAERIIFLFSKDSVGKCSEIADWVEKVGKYLKLNRAFTFVGEDDWNREDKSRYCVDSSNPGDIYKKINDIIEEEKKQNIEVTGIALDITGGKKTMVSGAFTAAAIMRIDTYYVDFDIYEDDRPKPGTEFLSKLPNPIIIQEINEKLEKGKITFDEIDEEFKNFTPKDLK